MTGTNYGVGKGKAQMFAVERYKVVDEVLEHYRNNVPSSQISKKLALKGIKIPAFSINRFLAKYRYKDFKKSDIVNTEKFGLITMDYKTEITSILEEVKQMKVYAKSQSDLLIYDKMIGRLYQGIELLAKLMGDIKTNNTVDLTILINDLNRKAFNDNKGQRMSLFRKEPIIDIDAEILDDAN